MAFDLVARLGWIAACLVLGLLLTWQAPVNAEAARRSGRLPSRRCCRSG